MFYYPAVLTRHTGCFSTICVWSISARTVSTVKSVRCTSDSCQVTAVLTGCWLVATKGIRVPRRDILKVDVKSTCDDIMTYVLEQVPPPRPGLPRPRFSLYLSSQLQYGVVIVYHRQCAIFLEDLQSVMGQLVKARTSQKIDLDDDSRKALDFPDALSLLEEAEGAPDPLFGVMHMHPAWAMPSPNTLIQMGQEYLREVPHEHPELTPPAAAAAAATAAAAAAAIDSVPVLTASPEDITLRETEPLALPVSEFDGVELFDHYPDTVDFLLAQTDYFPEGHVEMQREEVAPGEEEREMERAGRDGDLEKLQTKDLTGATGLQPTSLSSEDAMLSPQEEPGPSVEEPGPPVDQLTPVSAPVMPSLPLAARERERPTLELEDVPPPEVKRRRKRQLVFFDLETQIPQEVLQQQIDDPKTETRSPPLPPPSSHRMLSAAELLNNPCTFLPDEVRSLWRRAATVTPVSGSELRVGERGPESTDSEGEREVIEAATTEEERLELQRVPRDVSEPEIFDIPGYGSLPLEASDQREASREISPMYTSEREGPPISSSASVLEDIPEVVDELLERAEAESSGLLPELAEQEAEPVLFQSLLPPGVDRRTVSGIFQRLLENLSARKVQAEQDEPYGDILILPGQGRGEDRTGQD